MSETATQTLSVKEAAQRLGVDDRTVRRWIHLRQFPHAYQLSPIKSSPYRIPEADIEDFELRRQTTATQ
ncbi:MAG: helix-turn-helix transcriptional regulator [Candidatus Promineifilaceae bacterium]